MVASLFAALFLCIFDPAASAPLNAGWIEYTFSHGIYCSSVRHMCTRLAHMVFWIEPSNPLTNAIGAGYIRFGANNSFSDWQGADAIEFEQHSFALTKSTRVQAYNFMHQSFFELDALNDQSKLSDIDVKLFLNDGADGTSYLQLPQPIALKEVISDVPDDPERASFYDHGNSTIECYGYARQCRLQVHVVFKYAPKGNFMDNYNYVGSGKLYLNNNTSAERDGTLNVVWEKAMLYGYGVWYHGSNWGYDQIGDYDYYSKEIKTVCWKIWVMELQGTHVFDIPMDGGYGGYQKSKYVRCFEPEVHFWK